MIAFPAHPLCARCELHKTVPRNVGVPTIHLGLPPTAEIPTIIWLGMNPGYYEHVHNVPFFPEVLWDKVTGEPRPNAGYTFRNVYLKALEAEERAANFVTNVVRCGPQPEPPAACAKACWPWTEDDLAHIFTYPASSFSVVCLGGYAIAHFFKLLLGRKLTLHEALTRNGTEYEFNCNDSTYPITVFSTYHPAAVNRREAYIRSVERHLNLLDDHLEGTAPCPTKPTIIPPRAPRTMLIHCPVRIRPTFPRPWRRTD